MSEALTMELDTAPRVFVLYGRAVVARKPGLSRGGVLPEIRARLRNVENDRSRVEAYAKLCGFANTDPLPLTYPFLPTFPLLIQIMSHAQFPLPLLGTIHLNNKIVLHRAIALAERLDYDCRITATRWVDMGVEFDVTTHASTGGQGQEVWTCVSTFLRRMRSGGAGGGTKDKARQEALTGTSRETWKIPSDLGRRYARVSGDFNPIHLTSVTAKAFGFPRAIAHGMWSKSRAVAALGPDVSKQPATVEVRFKAPVLLPTRVVFVREQGSDGVTQFELQGDGSGRVHLSGSLRTP